MNNTPVCLTARISWSRCGKTGDRDVPYGRVQLSCYWQPQFGLYRHLFAASELPQTRRWRVLF